MSDLEPASQKPFLPEFVERARDVISVQRVFGEPIETDGAIVVPAATVSGGGGGGTGLESDGRQGNGGGFGLHARPAGALVIRDGDARWEPAHDPERRIVAGTIVAVVGILAARSAIRSLLRPRRRRRRPRRSRRG
jgi:uncharacterized spore protein YtfJ